MKITLIHPHDILSAPWTIRIVKIAESLQKRGHSVRLIYFPYADRRKKYRTRFAVPDTLEVIDLPKKKARLFQTMRRLREISADSDIIHFQKCNPHAAFPALWAAFRNDVPVHYDWDDWETGICREWSKSPLEPFVMSRYEAKLPLLVDSMSAASHALRERAVKIGFPPDRIADAPVGADLTAFHPDNSGVEIAEKYGLVYPTALYLGQLEGGSFGHLFLEAASLVFKEVSEVNFLVVGGGGNLPRLKEQAEKLGIAGNTVFTDYVHHEDVPAIVSAADIAVATFEETDYSVCKSPLKIAEYMAAGKSVVATDIGEVPRMLGDAGKLVKPDNIRDLATKILELLYDPDLRLRLGIKARQRAESVFNWDQTAGNILVAYEKAINEGPWN